MRIDKKWGDYFPPFSLGRSHYGDMAAENKKNQSSKDKERTVNSLRKRLYTLKEAAQYLGRSLWGMRELIWAGEILVVRGDGNRKIFLDIKDIDEYIERNKFMYQ